MSEFNLRKNRINAKEFIESECDYLEDYNEDYFIYPENSVKEFIKRLKEELSNPDFFSPAQIKIIEEFIDKLSGFQEEKKNEFSSTLKGRVS